MLDTPVGSVNSIFQIHVNGYSDGGSLYLQCESKGSGMQPVYGWSGVLGLQAPVLHSTGLRKACTVTTPKAELFQGAFNKFMAGSCRFAKQSLTKSDWIKGPGVDRSEIKQEIEDLLQLGVVMCKSAPQGFPRDKARALMGALVKLKGHCTGKLKLDKSEHIVQTTKEVRIHFHTFKDSIASMENLRLKQTVQVTIEIAASKAKDAATMSHSPLAILIWAFAAKEAGSWAFKYATLEGIKPADSANSDVNGTVWEKMKTILCTSTALTPNEVERLGLHLLTDTQAGDRVPELRQLHERALEKLKNHGHLIAGNMIETLRDAKYQLVASDFLTQERAEFMRKQSEGMQQQEEARQKASAAAGDAVVSALEEIKRQNDATKSDVPELVANLVTQAFAEIHSQGSTVLLNRQEQPNKLPLLKNWAMEAWRAHQSGMKITEIATTLSEKYKDPKITQPRVSEQIKIALMHAETSGLAKIAANVIPKINSRAPARTLDPSVADLGNRSDGRSHLVRDKEKQKAKDGDDD